VVSIPLITFIVGVALSFGFWCFLGQSS
jgi:hypothetical protein